MDPVRVFSIISWIALPTVMFGGYSLLRLLSATNKLTPFQATFFRAGHAHAGVLLVASLARAGDRDGFERDRAQRISRADELPVRSPMDAGMQEHHGASSTCPDSRDRAACSRRP